VSRRQNGVNIEPGVLATRPMILTLFASSLAMVGFYLLLSVVAI
jgi:hypothetical protein